MANTILFSVIFPNNLQFFDSFLKSLTRQSDKDFSLALIVDQVPDIDRYTKQYEDLLSVEHLHAVGNIASIRAQGLSWVRTLKANKIIFADTDDMLSADRVSNCKGLLESYPVVVNDLSPFFDEQAISENGYWCSRLEDKQNFSFESILNSNFAGLGNTAVRKEVITEVHIPDSLQAVDWFLFSHWMNNEKVSGIFSHSGKVLYRQHANNMAGAKKTTVESLFNIINTKINHYKNLLALYPFFKEQLKSLHELKDNLLADGNYLKATIENLNNRSINYFWWEETEYIHE